MAVVPFPDPQAPKSAVVPDPDPWTGDPEFLDGRMSFLEHLDELRKRIVYSLVALVLGVCVTVAFISRIFDFIMQPLQQMLPPGGALIYTEPTEAFLLYVKIALLAGLLVSAPFIMWQVWLFVAPGLYAKEKRFAIPFVVLSSVGFFCGAAFSHYFVFPLMWRFFAGFSNQFVTFAPRIQPAFSLYLRMVLALGLVFQMPSVVFFLAKMGVVTARWMLRNFKYAVLLMFVAAAVITPGGDMAGQSLIALPMIGLYMLSVGIAWVFGKKPTDAADADE